MDNEDTLLQNDTLLVMLNNIRDDLTEFRSHIKVDIAQFGGKIQLLADSFNTFQITYASESTTIRDKADAAHRRLDILEPKLNELENSVKATQISMVQINHKLALLVGIVTFIGVVVGGYLLEQILGRVFP